ncbi:MAG TPA: enoyl-CoA hydratase/isomerase family protein [Gemmatimonadaceae bacterium]|nr:enoyl-CoA hydratase/isomerase family protein [Gemmatimonadaceae bacterium]
MSDAKAHPFIETGEVRSVIADGIATLSFYHPKGNSLPGALLAELAAGVARLGADPAVHVIVLRSEGAGPFCAGASFDELASIGDAARGKVFFSGFATLILAMRRCPRPIVTRVHGKVAGGGVGVVAASDYVVATRTAALRLSELAVGIGPFVVGPVIERKIGPGAFAAMALDAAWRDAAWGERFGLYAKVCEDDAALDAEVTAIAASLAKANPEAIALLKEIFWKDTPAWDALLEERAAMSGRLVLSEHTRRAIEAFRNR